MIPDTCTTKSTVCMWFSEAHQRTQKESDQKQEVVNRIVCSIGDELHWSMSEVVLGSQEDKYQVEKGGIRAVVWSFNSLLQQRNKSRCLQVNKINERYDDESMFQGHQSENNMKDDREKNEAGPILKCQ